MLPKIERISPVIPIKEVNHSNLLLIHKPYSYEFPYVSLGGNIPIIEVEGVNLYLPNNVLFLNDEGTQKLVRIGCYQDGDQEFQMAATM